MESSDEEEIIENNSYDDELDPKEIGQKPSNINNPKIISKLKPQNNNLTNNNIKQVKNTNTSKISSKQSPKPKQIISVSVILPKNTQPPKKNLTTKNNNSNITKNSNNPFRNQGTKPKFKASNEIYQEVKNDIDIQNNNNVLIVKKESNNIINNERNNYNKIKKK